MSPKVKEYAINTFSVFNTHIQSSKIKNVTKERRFVNVFNIDVLGTLQALHPPDVTLGDLQDVLGTFTQKRKSIQQLNFQCFRYKLSEIGLKIMQQKSICMTCSKLTPWGDPKNINLWTSLHEVFKVLRTFLHNCQNIQQITFQYFM